MNKYLLKRFKCIVMFVLLVCALSCGSGSDKSGNDDSEIKNKGELEPNCVEPTEVECEDTLILELNLQKEAAPGLISNTEEGNSWLSIVDATAGGAFITVPDSYVYAVFTDSGLSKVDIGDEQAIESMEWDIAFRRYVVRLNSGSSGPSCTRAARDRTNSTFDDMNFIPDAQDFREDDLFTDPPTCGFIPDGTGLPGSPATALSSFWDYPGCVQMSNNVYIVQLREGGHVKLMVTAYYTPTHQQQCQDDPSNFNSMQNTGSANVRLKWAFLD